MGKAEAMTAKAISNRIKAKGLNKLRWYCQPCEKSCRDENGYKCHINTESHHRAMLLFAENANVMLTDYSRQFKDGFLDILRKRYGTRRVFSNQVYNEYIADRHHIHMNATCWNTLSAFVKYLGREGEVKAEEDERGWYITYIDRSPETLKRMERDARREREERDYIMEERQLLEEQIRRANEELQLRQQRQSISTTLSSISGTPNNHTASSNNGDSPLVSTNESSFLPCNSSDQSPTIESGCPSTPSSKPSININFAVKHVNKPIRASKVTPGTSSGNSGIKKKSLSTLMSQSTALAAISTKKTTSSSPSTAPSSALYAAIELDKQRCERRRPFKSKRK